MYQMIINKIDYILRQRFVSFFKIIKAIFITLMEDYVKVIYIYIYIYAMQCKFFFFFLI